MKAINKSSAALLCLSAVLHSPITLAIPLTIAGTHVSFTYEDSLAGLFGTPVVAGDSFYFTPTEFEAQSIGQGLVVTSETFNVTVTANSGYVITSAQLNEEGDYYKLGPDGDVAVGGKLIVRDLAAPLTSISSSITPTTSLEMTTSLDDFELTGWDAIVYVDLPDAWGSVDGINVTIKNVLLAYSPSAGSSSYIGKTFAGLTVATSPVPETKHYTMLLAGLGLVGCMVRRKNHLPKNL